MYYKETTFSIIDSDVMNIPSLVKHASASVMPEKYDPDFFYVRVRSISAGEYFGSNRNADYFQEVELIKGHPTFLDAHVFKNHENKDVANAIGSIISSTWNNDMKCVELIIKIDRQLAPTIVRGFEKGYTTDVSMGCRVDYTVCSICGNKAKTRAEFCEHVKTMRNKINPDGSKVFEYNYGPRFHDLSIVLNGADRTAKVLQIYREDSMPVLDKSASTSFSDNSFADHILKVASEERFDKSVTPELTEPFFNLTLSKLAGFRKEITDKLYIISLLNRLEDNGTFTDEDIEEILLIGKEAGIPFYLGLEKYGTLGRDIRNIALGSISIAGLTNYFQGKRLRGEPTSSVENFVADNPGVLPALFIIGGYPAYKGLRNNAAASKVVKNLKSSVSDYSPFKKFAFSYTDLFTKEASETLSGELVVDTSALLDSPRVSSLLTNEFGVPVSTQNLSKMALYLYAAGREDIVDLVKQSYSITDDDLTKVALAGIIAASEDLEKEASLTYGVLVSNLFNTQKIPTGLSAPLLAGSIVDGFLISKLFGTPGGKKREDVKDTVSYPVKAVEGRASEVVR